METDTTFAYNYSALQNKEVQEIRKRYMAPQENKLEELKRLDQQVQLAGFMQSLAVGIISCLIFGVAMCMGMGVFGGGLLISMLGVVVGMIGAAGMIAAYPVYRKISWKTKEELAPRILQLADELEQKK